MAKVLKSLTLAVKSADAQQDIALINQFSKRELTPDEVYCFSVVMCDNDIDRDLERFTNKTLDKFAEMFVGRTVISDHSWLANRQIGRIYACEVQKTTEQNQAGEPLRKLIAKVYMLKTEENKATIDKIEGGILKEVSVGCQISKRACSLCGTTFRMNWSSWEYECENHHKKGETYPGEGYCFVELEDPTDAYELSFVAVPAQRNAGVTKSVADHELDDAFDTLLSCPDLSDHPKFPDLLMLMKQSSMSAADRRERSKILVDNAKIIKLYERK